MENTNKMPLLVVFLWHPDDKSLVKPIVDYCFNKLSRDRSNLYSRTVNLPIRFCTSKDNSLPEYQWEKAQAEEILLFCFSSANLINSGLYGNDWPDDIICKINYCRNVKFIGIAVDDTGYKLKPTDNFIRMADYENDTNLNNRMFIAIAHQIYQYSINKNKIKIFLSHNKRDEYAVKFTRQIKSYIDSHSDMQSFFDVTSIEPGTDFDDKIESGINGASIIAVRSDHYAGSYWCQKEILKALRCTSPIVVADMLENYEDRSFPYLTNCPVTRIQHADVIDVLRILESVLLESIRFRFSLMQISINNDNEVTSAHPPALYDVITSPPKGVVKYPYPDIYVDERTLLLKRYKKVYTSQSGNSSLWEGKKVGVSISESEECDLIKNGVNKKHLELLSVELAGYFIGNNAKYIYGGDFREKGFTRYLYEEASAQKNRLNYSNSVCTNYVAWPYYLKSDDETEKWKAQCKDVLELNPIWPPEDVKEYIIDVEKVIYHKNYMERYVKTRCLTEMRNSMIDACDIRICAGGRITGYSGTMPGVLEEVLITLSQEKPLYLLGGFGGITSVICRMLIGESFPQELSKTWQWSKINMSEDECNMMESNNDKLPNYEQVSELLKLDNLKNGLSLEENKILFFTPSVEVILGLIAKGYEKLQRRY